jgi:hypothetical protein
MQGEAKERWKELCEQAAVERDPEAFTALIRELNDVLEEKERRLKATQSKSSGQPSGLVNLQ